jgi:hypothetical protein
MIRYSKHELSSYWRRENFLSRAVIISLLSMTVDMTTVVEALLHLYCYLGCVCNDDGYRSLLPHSFISMLGNMPKLQRLQRGVLR